MPRGLRVDVPLDVGPASDQVRRLVSPSAGRPVPCVVGRFVLRDRKVHHVPRRVRWHTWRRNVSSPCHLPPAVVWRGGGGSRRTSRRQMVMRCFCASGGGQSRAPSGRRALSCRRRFRLRLIGRRLASCSELARGASCVNGQREHQGHQVPRLRPELTTSLRLIHDLGPFTESHFLPPQPPHRHPIQEAGISSIIASARRRCWNPART